MLFFFKVLKKLLLKISDYCQESTSTGASFSIKTGLSCRPTAIFIKKDTLAQVFPKNVEKHL